MPQNQVPPKEKGWLDEAVGRLKLKVWGSADHLDHAANPGLHRTTEAAMKVPRA